MLIRTQILWEMNTLLLVNIVHQKADKGEGNVLGRGDEFVLFYASVDDIVAITHLSFPCWLSMEGTSCDCRTIC